MKVLIILSNGITTEGTNNVIKQIKLSPVDAESFIYNPIKV